MLKNIKIYDKRSKFFCNIIKIEERNRIRIPEILTIEYSFLSFDSRKSIIVLVDHCTLRSKAIAVIFFDRKKTHQNDKDDCINLLTRSSKSSFNTEISHK